MRPISIFLFFMVVGLTSSRAGDDTFDLQLSKSECYPGDVIHIQVTMRSTHVRDYHVSVPYMDELHVIGIEKHPVHIESGSYVQAIHLIVQPTRAGSLAIEGAEMVMGSYPVQERIPLPTVNLIVHSYDSGEDSLDAESLPPAIVAKSGYTVYWVAGIALALALVSAIGYWRWPPRAKLGEVPTAKPTLADLLQQVSGNSADRALVESFLTSPDQKLSPPLRRTMLQCTYGECPDWDALEKALFKEVGK